MIHSMTILFRLSPMVPWIEVGCNIIFSLLRSEVGRREDSILCHNPCWKQREYEILCSVREHGCWMWIARGQEEVVGPWWAAQFGMVAKT